MKTFLIAGEVFADLPPPIEPDPFILEENWQQKLELLMEDLEEETDVSELLSELEMLQQRPINLNTARADDLRRLFFLQDIQINNLITHREKFGNLISIMELQSIDGFTIETINMIQPYVTVQEKVERRKFTFNDVISQGRSQYFLRYQRYVEEQAGYSFAEPEIMETNPNARYLGSPFRLYNRYRFTYYNNLSIGITAEKDPGEQFFKGTQKNGFDFYSAHLYIRNVGRIKALSIGDYQVQFGQGLSLWSGLAFGKSSETINIKKNGLGLRPYTSVDENNFMRGAGATVALGSFEITTFYSEKARDATIVEIDTLNQETLVVSSLQQSGLHRTPRELDNRKSINEMYYGSNITFRKHNYHIGFTAHQMKIDAMLNRNLTYYNQFDFNNDVNSAASLDYSYLYRNINAFGEIASSRNGGYAILNGIMVSLDPRLSISLLHRKFSPDYQSLVSAAFSENTRVQNETGIYAGIYSRLTSKWSIQAYADHFVFPWMKYRTFAPTRGFDYLVQVNFRPQRRTELYLRYRLRNKPLNAALNQTIQSAHDQTRQNIRLHFSYPVSPSFSFKNRIEVLNYNHADKKQQGFLIYQDIAYRHFNSPWAITLRYALFDTDGYDSRIYAYENDVLYAFSFPYYADKGHRTYIIVRYRLNRNIDFQTRLAQSVYINRDQIGSGLDRIEGNTRTEIKAQMRVRF